MAVCIAGIGSVVLISWAVRSAASSGMAVSARSLLSVDVSGPCCPAFEPSTPIAPCVLFSQSAAAEKEQGAKSPRTADAEATDGAAFADGSVLGEQSLTLVP